MSNGQRLRDLDRRAGAFGPTSPDRWRRSAARWHLLAAVAVAQVALVVVMCSVDAEVGAGMSALGFQAVLMAFLAGRWKSEHDHLRGAEPRIFGARRPEGL